MASFQSLRRVAVLEISPKQHPVHDGEAAGFGHPSSTRMVNGWSFPSPPPMYMGGGEGRETTQLGSTRVVRSAPLGCFPITLR